MLKKLNGMVVHQNFLESRKGLELGKAFCQYVVCLPEL